MFRALLYNNYSSRSQNLAFCYAKRKYMNLWTVFLTGLTVGGLTCLAVQGGLLASTIAVREEDDLQKGSTKKHTIYPTLAFLAAKLVVYTLLGFLLGLFGRAISISQTVQITMQFIAGLYMVVVALDLLNVHPIFRYAVIQPPKFLARMVRNQSRRKDLFAPAFLGAMTIFIPCGTTLAIEALTLTTKNPFIGAFTMFLFVLGTTPLFFGVGWITSVLGDNFQGKFLKIAAIAVIYLGITSMNGALVAGGSPITLQSIAENFPIQIDLSGGEQAAAANSARTLGGVQTVDISVFPNGYSPSNIRVKAGMPVKLNLTPSGGLGCTSIFRMPQLGITKTLASAGITEVEFTPQTPGKYTWTCSMGMYRGVMEVI